MYNGKQIFYIFLRQKNKLCKFLLILLKNAINYAFMSIEFVAISFAMATAFVMWSHMWSSPMS